MAPPSACEIERASRRRDLLAAGAEPATPTATSRPKYGEDRRIKDLRLKVASWAAYGSASREILADSRPDHEQQIQTFVERAPIPY